MTLYCMNMQASTDFYNCGGRREESGRKAGGRERESENF